MNKKEKRYFIITWISIALVILAIAILAGYWWNLEVERKEHEFFRLYLPERAVLALEKWSDYFELDKWMVFNTIMTESNGDQYAKSHANCKGYMQLSSGTAKACRTRLYKLIKWKSYNIYKTDINIASGCLHLKNLQENFTGKDELLTIEIYNTGWYNYKHKRRRAPLHVKRYGINKTAFKLEFKRR
jgi:soluble lytic murein transglycosylase-like protein